VTFEGFQLDQVFDGTVDLKIPISPISPLMVSPLRLAKRALGDVVCVLFLTRRKEGYS